MLKSQDMTPEQRKFAVEYLETLEMDDHLSIDEVEVILDYLVDIGLATKSSDGRWILQEGVSVSTYEEDDGE